MLKALMAAVLLALLAAGPAAAQGIGGSMGSPQILNVLILYEDDGGREQAPIATGTAPWASRPYTPSTVPRLDSFAAEGIAISQMHTQPVCTASRVMLLTGLLCTNSGVCANSSTLATSTVTLPDVIEASFPGRYEFVHLGKWGGVGTASGTAGDFGFDRRVGTVGNIPNYDYLSATDFELGRAPDETIAVTYPAGTYQTDQQTQTFRDEIDAARADGIPRFIILSHSSPHNGTGGRHDPADGTPYTATCPTYPSDDYPCFQAMFEDAANSAMDAVAYLTPAELASYLIVWIPDNGSDSGYFSGQPLDEWASVARGNIGKGTIYEPGTNVGAIIRYPRMHSNTKGMKIDAYVDTADLHATIIDILGANATPAGYVPDGVSFARLVTGDCTALDCDAAPKAHLYAVDGGDPDWRAVTDTASHWKLHHGNTGKGSELYDLDADPKEQNDLCAGDCAITTSGNAAICNALVAALAGFEGGGPLITCVAGP
jgi:arylsulfatase A-like enzyme